MWNKITIADDTAGNQKAKILQDTFGEVFMISGGPSGAAMFTNRERHGREHTFYFSPEAVSRWPDLMTLHWAEECEGPASDQVTLLVGQDSARDTAKLS